MLEIRHVVWSGTREQLKLVKLKTELNQISST